MPPKKDDAPKAKKKAELPKEPCGCGANMYRIAPKGKKLSAVPEHAPGCSFQRATCNRYPHLPKCAACEEGCAYCAGINLWCHHCPDNKCRFIFKRDVLGWSKKGPERLGTADGSMNFVTPPGTAATK
jgi:hypothetical protein